MRSSAFDLDPNKLGWICPVCKERLCRCPERTIKGLWKTVCGKCSKPKRESEALRCHCGRPIEYSMEMITETEKYLSRDFKKEEDFPSIEGLALELGVSVAVMYEWTKEYREFMEVIDNLRHLQANFLLKYGVWGKFNPTITKVILTKHGYREGIDATSGDKPLGYVDPKAKQEADSVINRFLFGKK